MKKYGRTLALLAIIPFFFVATGSAAEVANKVAVLPFQINADRNLDYLRNGILDMLSSRLAWEGKVQVLEKQLVKEAIAGHQGPLNEAAAREIGTGLGADYVLFGSLTIFGESVSMDAKMLALTTDRPPVTIYAQTKGMGEVIPRINDFAQDINNKIFGRTPTAVAAAPVQPKFSQQHPEKLVAPGYVPGQPEGEQHSELNPYFVVPSTVASTGGFRQSRSLPLAVISMAVADVNGDTIQEILLLSPRELHIYQQASNRLRLIKTYKARKDDHFLWVSTADLNHNEIPEIYVSNRVREQLMSSFVLEWQGSDWIKTADGIHQHLRAMNLPGKGKSLLGQRGHEESPFAGDIFILKREGEEFRPLSPLPLPGRVNLYSFTLADLTGDGSHELLAVNRSDRLQIKDMSGETLWESDDRFAASFDYVQGVETDPRAQHGGIKVREKIYLNAPILIADLNQDEQAEVIVNKNTSGLLGRGLVERNFFGKSELYSFSWNGLAMVENWHTPAFNGMTTAYEVTDLNGDGQVELLVVLVSEPGTAVWKEAKSKVVVYPIATPAKKEEKG